MKRKNSIRENLYVRKWGTGDKTALLIHGLASSSLTWRYLAKDLTAIGYTVIAPDLRGHGQSSRSKKYSVESWTQDIVDLGISPDLLIGHSIGGLIAANAQKTLQAKKVVLIDPVFHLPTNRVVLRSIQQVFASNMRRRISKKNWNLAKLKSIDHARVQFIEVGNWDSRTALALKPLKTVILNCLTGTQDVMLMRAKKSYIVPMSIMKRKFTENVKLLNFSNSAHDIHMDTYDLFWSSLQDFIDTQKENIINARNHLSLSSAL